MHGIKRNFVQKFSLKNKMKSMEGHSYIERVFGWSSPVLVPLKSRPILNVVQFYTPEPTKTSGDQTTLEKAGRGRERQRKMN